MTAYIKGGENAKTFRTANAALAAQVMAKLRAAGVTIAALRTPPPPEPTPLDPPTPAKPNTPLQ